MRIQTASRNRLSGSFSMKLPSSTQDSDEEEKRNDDSNSSDDYLECCDFSHLQRHFNETSNPDKYGARKEDEENSSQCTYLGDSDTCMGILWFFGVD